MIFERLMLTRRAARIVRMHTMPTHHMQTVGEHTFGVLALLDYVHPEASVTMWRAALHHDVTEALTGDVPATTKWEYPEIEEALRIAEGQIAAQYDLEETDTEHQESIIKFCDIMELAMFAIEEIDGGDRRMVTVARNCLNAIKLRRLEDVTPAALQLYKAVAVEFEARGDVTEETRYGNR